MSKAIKLKNDVYLDSTGIVHNGINLKTVLDGINSKVNTLYENPVGEFTIWEGDVTKVGNGTWTQLGTYYFLKSCIENKFPLKTGFKRSAKIYIEEVDNKQSGNIYVKVSGIDSNDTYSKEYLFPPTWGGTGSSTLQVKTFKMLDFDYNGLTGGHKDIFVTPDFATNGTVRIYKVGLLIYDKPI
jgi:hypothetical protein